MTDNSFKNCRKWNKCFYNKYYQLFLYENYIFSYYNFLISFIYII